MALANITNNILTDSGILVSSLQGALTLTTTGSSGASTLIGNTLNIPNYGGGLTGYVPYTGATGSVNLGTNDLTSRYLVANGSAGLGGVLNIKQDAAYSPLGNGFSSIASSSNSFDFFGYTGASTYKNFQLRFDGLTNNTVRTYTLPDASGTIALTSALSGMVTGTGTTNYLPKFTGTSTIGNSLVVDNGTNVGIGTTNPTAGRLQINVSDTTTAAHLQIVDGTTTLANAFVTNFRNANDGNGRYSLSSWQVQNAVGNDQNGFIGVQSVTGAGAYTPNIVFGQKTGASSYATRMTLDASGNLGLGVTPSAWGSTVRALQFENGGSIASNQSTQVSFNNNVYSVPGTNDYYISSAFASRYIQFQGQHIWSTAPSGTAGNAISFTQAMTLNASGNLSIGNTNDTYKLDVSGSARFNGSGSNGYLYVSGNAGSGGSTNPAYVQGMNFSWNKSNGGGESLITYTGAGGGSNIRFGIGYWNNTTYAEQFTIASTGAATFSSSVTATGTITMNKTGGYGILAQDNGNNLAANGAYIGWTNTANTRYYIGQLDTNNDLNYHYFNGSTWATSIMKFSNTGAATFSSSVTAGANFRANNGGFESYDSSYNLSMYQNVSGGTGGLYSSSNNAMAFWTNATERMRITSGGNVGIGTTSPLSKLDVYGGAANTISSIRTDSFDGTYYAALNFGTGGQGDSYPVQAQIRVVGENNYSANIRFYTQISGTANPLAERMRITSGGNVGIGTTSPAEKLEVNGNIKTAAPSGGSAGSWKLGTVYTGTCVPSNFGDFTSWFQGTVIEIEVNGTTYKIPAVIDNYC